MEIEIGANLVLAIVFFSLFLFLAVAVYAGFRNM